MDKITYNLKKNNCYEQLVPLGAMRDVPMSEHTSFRIGGNADIFFVPHNNDVLIFALNTAKANDMPIFVMGNGTNLLVHDDGIRALVIKLRDAIPQIEFNSSDNTVTVSAQTLLSTLAKRTVEEGFMGLEWAAGIPGTVGGAVAMNAGAYGGEVKDYIIGIKGIMLTENGYTMTEIQPCAEDFGYRYSKYAYPRFITLSVTFGLLPDDGMTLERMNDYNKKRTTKQPLSFPSAGSVFKRPEGYFAGALIEQANLKGMTVGGAQVSQLHAGFIVNIGGATAKDVTTLISLIKERVYQNSGVMLEEELKITGG